MDASRTFLFLKRRAFEEEDPGLADTPQESSYDEKPESPEPGETETDDLSAETDWDSADDSDDNEVREEDSFE